MSEMTTELERLLQGCESEKLHLSGAVQSFGALLRIDADTRKVTHASANLVDYLGISATDVLGKTTADLDCLPASALENLAPTPGKTLHISNVAHSGPVGVDATLIRSPDGIVIELERSAGTVEALAVHQYQRPLMNLPGSSDELRDYHRTLLELFREITGFDRFMIYRFQEDWVGEVIAEVVEPGRGSYLGLCFPASDIPAIARNLYLINPSRLIHDAGAAAVPILSLDATPPDLTWSDLRSVSPVHLEYLSNMGVAASFSVPIKVAGKLWGLVSCHKAAPMILSMDQREACVGFVSVYALGLTSYLSAHRLRMLDSLDRSTEGVLAAIAEHQDPLDGVEKNATTLMKALDASSFALAVGDNVVIAGEGPDVDGLAVLDDWFMNDCQEAMFVTDHLVGVVPFNDLVLSRVTGFVAIKARSLRSGWVRLYWFRPGEVQEIAWAGNPNKPVSENPGAVHLSPRRSFERWVETKTGYCRAWSNEHRLVASKFRNGLLRWL